MKRTIKFRAWDGSKMLDNFQLRKHFNDNTFHAYINQSALDEMPLMQFTGMKDRNGNEIYEGDIIKIPATKRHPEWIGYIVWNNTYPGFEILLDKHNWMPIEETNEVIGNIYQNSELINQ